MSTRICTLCDAEILIFPSSPFSMTTVLETVPLAPNCRAVTVPAEPPLFAPVVTVPALPVPLIAVTDATMAATPVDGNPACPDTANVSNVPPGIGPAKPPVPVRVSTSRACNGTNCPPVPVGSAAAAGAATTATTPIPATNTTLSRRPSHPRNLHRTEVLRCNSFRAALNDAAAQQGTLQECAGPLPRTSGIT